MTENDVILNLRILTYFAVDLNLHWGRVAWYRRAVGYYRTAVGYYRVIAQKILKTKNLYQYLFKTSKINKIRPVTAENDNNEKRLNFYYRNPGFSFIFLETSDLTTMYKRCIPSDPFIGLTTWYLVLGVCFM